jgi:hypothetical protein
MHRTVYIWDLKKQKFLPCKHRKYMSLPDQELSGPTHVRPSADKLYLLRIEMKNSKTDKRISRATTGREGGDE